MYPRTELNLDPDLPSSAEYWTPQAEDIGEEGFGYFRDVWPILDVTEDEARNLQEEDRRLASFVSLMASKEDEFEIIARTIERASDAYGYEKLRPEQRSQLERYLVPEEDDYEAVLGGLDIGVAGLVYAISAAGMFPAASCRGHSVDRAWSDVPVVLFAADLPHARVLQPLVRTANCGFTTDRARPELLVVTAGSIDDTLKLADDIIDNLESFRAVQPPANRIEHLSAESPGQLELFRRLEP